MNTQEKKERIKSLVIDMLNDSHKKALENVDKLLNSSAINIDNYDTNNTPMILPKSILTAILEYEAKQYAPPKGITNERKIKQDIKNFGYFL